ncbi:MAG: amidase [Caldimonas sp.]
MSDELCLASAGAIAMLVRERKLSAQSVMRRFLDRCDRLEPMLNTFVTRTDDLALSQAWTVDQALAAGHVAGPLAGVPVTIKDLIAVQGQPLTFGSLLFAQNVAREDAPAVARLRRAGACMLGKTTTSELGSKAVGDSPLSGATRNPWNTGRTAGGSSAGAAAGVAAGMAPIALGTDGGGSIRIPSACCGTAGFKATFGRVPVWPASAAPSLAHVAPLANEVGDLALVLSVIEGHDPRDPFSYPLAPDDATPRPPARWLRVGWCASFGGRTAAPEIEPLIRAALQRTSDDLALLELPELNLHADIGALWSTEFYGGIRARLGVDADAAALDPALREQMRRLPPDGVAFHRLQSRRLAVFDAVEALFERCDFIAAPTLPCTAPPVGVNTPAGMEHCGPVDWSFFTYPFNLTGHPALSIPVGLAADGLPVGLQLIGRKHRDAELLALACAIERRIGFDTQRRQMARAL